MYTHNITTYTHTLTYMDYSDNQIGSYWLKHQQYNTNVILCDIHRRKTITCNDVSVIVIFLNYTQNKLIYATFAVVPSMPTTIVSGMV